jgi:predicted enzyme related to lactoylglutathione lyase
MPALPLFQLARACAVATLVGLGFPLGASTASFQPLHEPATGEQHPGKVVWADLFTTDPAAATKFYCGLFGWTANAIDQNGKAYTVFSNGRIPVAGLAPRNSANKKRPSRWISYVAVTDLRATVALVAAAGGQVRAPVREFPHRGSQAIVTDIEGSPIGLLQSTSGDSTDGETKPGDWNWFELYAKEPKVTSAFYAKVLNYAVKPDDRTERKDDYLLTTDGYARAGIAPLPDQVEARAGWLGVVRVESLDETLARVPKLGGEVLVTPRATAYESRFAIIADSTGGTIGLVEFVNNAPTGTRP